MHTHCLKKVTNTLIIATLLSTQWAIAKEVPWDKLQGLGHVEYFDIKNKKKADNKAPYHIFIRLPEEYNTSKKQDFPVLYLLDGGTNFPLFAAAYTYLRWMQDVPPMIIVGISYGTHDWRRGNHRSHDYTAPSSEREHWGGAKVFDQFFSEKLMPAIKQKYRVDSAKQILFGQSLGGQFALYSSMYGNAPFYGVIASNPALHRNINFFKRPVVKRNGRPKVFVSIAEFDDPQFKTHSEVWVKYWQKQKIDWDHQFTTLVDQNHLSATPDTLRNGLKWLLNN